MSTETNQAVPAAVANDWEIHTHQDKELVKGLGLTSATMLVMGSMIGSGIFIVSAEIAREVDSPALLIGAWVVTGLMTIVAALSYGELAAMMPRAGGQYVYLREALGPLWGFLYGWTLFLVIQTGTIAAVGVAFGKFLGVFVPSISSTHWLLHLWKVPPIPIGPMVLGNMDVGLSTQNLVAILVVVALSVINIFGLKTGALIQNVFTFAKVSALLGLVLLGLSKKPLFITCLPGNRISKPERAAAFVESKLVYPRSPSSWFECDEDSSILNRSQQLRKRAATSLRQQTRT